MLKPSSKVASVVVRLFIASLFLALPAITAQESHAVVVPSCTDGGPCAVGDVGPGGGTVYYIAASGTTFTESTAACKSDCNMLEWAPNTWSGSTKDPLIAWDEVGVEQIITLNAPSSATDYSGSGALGAGKSNTGRMQGVNGWTEGTIPGYGGTDSSSGQWFIPSQKELQLILTSGLDLSSFCRGSAGSHPAGCAASSFYWSSTDISTTDAVGADFSNSTLAAATKTTSKYVRLVRAFSATIKASDVAPTIASATISGTVKVDQVLTATGNTVTGTPTPTATYEWKAGGSVVGSNSETYTIATGDLGKTITVKITVANTVSPSASATSNPTAAVAAADTSPGITSATISGIVKVGEVLTATANGVTGSPTPTATYQWRAGESVVGTNSSTYTIASGDLGKTITVRITESNGVGSNAAATSTPTTAVSSSTTGIGSSGDAFIPLAANSSTNLNSTKLTGPGQALQITGYTDSSTIKVVVTSNFGKVGISVTTGLSAVVTYPSNLSESATAIAFTGTKTNLNAALNSFKYFAPADAGNAYLLFTVTSDGYEPPLTRSLNIAVKKSQAVLRITNTDRIASIGDTVTVRAVGGSGSGSISYSVTRVGGGDGCVIDENTGVLTTEIDTNCLVVATRAGDGTYSSVTSDSAEFEFNPKNQPTPIVIGYNKLVITRLDETITVSATGGDGNGALSFATKSENCYIDGNTIHAIQSGPCDVIATRAPNGKYAIATSQWPTTFFVNITQSVSDSITVVVPTTLEAGDSLTLTTNLTPVGSPLEFSMEYKVNGTGCSYDPETHKISTQKAAYCTVVAFWAKTSAYKYQQSPQVLIRFNLKTPSALTIPDTYTAVVGTSLVITATGGNPDTSTVSYRVTGTGCSDATPSNSGRSITLSVNTVAYCSVIASQPTDGKYASVVSASKTITFGLLSSPTLTITNIASRYLAKTPITLTTSVGNDGAVTYSVVEQQSSSSPKCADGGLCKVGDTGPGGGIVYYVSPTSFSCGVDLSQRCNALEAAPKGWSGGSADPTRDTFGSQNFWVGDLNILTLEGKYFKTEEPLGVGAKNTALIIAQPGPKGSAADSNIPAAIARAYRGGSLSDWYLPTAHELYQLCAYTFGSCETGKSEVKNSSVGLTTSSPTSADNYWTSSVTWSSYSAVVKMVRLTVSPGGSVVASPKVLSDGAAYSVRPIRAFSYNPAGSCVLDGTTLSSDKATLCLVTASQSAFGSYGAVLSSPKGFYFNTISAPALSLPDTGTAKAGREFTLVATGGNPDLETANFVLRGANCGSAVVDGKSVTFTPTSATACTVTVSQNATDTYNFVSFTKSYSFTFDSAPTLLVRPETTTAFVGVALAITVEGGNPDTSTVTYRVTGNAACGSGTLSLDKRTITLQPSVATYCTISASQPAYGRYTYVTSTSLTIAFKVAQSPALIIDETITATAGVDLRFKARGGNGSTISYTVSGAGCSDKTTDEDGYLTIRTSAVVYCTVQARQNATASLTYAQSGAKTIRFAPSDFSGDLVVTNGDVEAGTVLELTNNADPFGDQVKYVVSAAKIGTFTTPTSGCSYSSITKSITNTGEAYCYVYAYWPSSSIYNYKQSAIKLIHFTVTAQSQFSISNTSTSVVKGNEIIVTTRGGSGTGAVTYAKKTSDSCSVTNLPNGTARIIASVASTCSITATKAAQGKYAKSTSQTVIFTFRKS